jgi:hypothetical protein
MREKIPKKLWLRNVKRNQLESTDAEELIILKLISIKWSRTV